MLEANALSSVPWVLAPLPRLTRRARASAYRRLDSSDTLIEAKVYRGSAGVVDASHTAVAASGSYKVRFIVGSYDRSGGGALGGLPCKATHSDFRSPIRPSPDAKSKEGVEAPEWRGFSNSCTTKICTLGLV